MSGLFFQRMIRKHGLDNTASRICGCTLYAEKLDLSSWDDACYWWLGSSGVENIYAAAVGIEGNIGMTNYVNGTYRALTYYGVRPSIYISLE